MILVIFDDLQEVHTEKRTDTHTYFRERTHGDFSGTVNGTEKDTRPRYEEDV